MRPQQGVPLLLLALVWTHTSFAADTVIGLRRGKQRGWLREQYLQSVKLSLTGSLLQTDTLVPGVGNHSQLQRKPYEHESRVAGLDWPDLGLTMVGHKRLDNIRALLETCLFQDVDGDFVECGVWRGGASIFARAVLSAWGDTTRNVILVDSFQGLPRATHHLDSDHWSEMEYLRVSKEQVQDNFRRYELLSDDVKFFRGFFNESTPHLSQWLQHHRRTISVLRLDGDMYSSVMDCLTHLYSHVSEGGFVIIDDWTIKVAYQAVTDFRQQHNITHTIHSIDESSVYWRKGTPRAGNTILQSVISSMTSRQQIRVADQV